jgi:DNA modification methylase
VLTILSGDCRETLKSLPDGSVNCCVTSPPYWGLRDYGHADQIGQEETPQKYADSIVSVFAEVWRVLRDDGTLWLNLGDCYCSTDKWGGGKGGNTGKHTVDSTGGVPSWACRTKRTPIPGIKPKNLIGIPWRVAFALQDAGWYLRSDIIWSKPNPMPESVTDRPTRAHEYVFLLTKSPRYYYDAGAIREPASPALIKQVEEGYNGHALKDYLSASVQDASATKSRIINGARKRIDKQRGHSRRHAGFNDKWDALTPAEQALLGSNKRSVWTVAPANYPGAHFATYPPALIKPCILAGCPSGGVVLDPFGGSGTTGAVALELGRRAILCELNPDYVEMIEGRCNVTMGLPLAATEGGAR